MKVVKFCNVPITFVYVDFCDSDYRRPYWELFVLDRIRFRDRIKKFEILYNNTVLIRKPTCLCVCLNF